MHLSFQCYGLSELACCITMPMLTIALRFAAAAKSVDIGALGDPRAKLNGALYEAAACLYSNLLSHEAKNQLITLSLRSIHIADIQHVERLEKANQILV